MGGIVENKREEEGSRGVGGGQDQDKLSVRVCLCHGE
jgi:hypothetical protein